VLLEIDFDYLRTWGHYQMMVEMHERLRQHLSDSKLKQASSVNLGTGYYNMGCISKAIACHEESLAGARAAKDRHDESAGLGQTERAIDYHEQALAIAREIGFRQGEANDLGNLGNCYYDLGQTDRAIGYHEQALAINRENGYRYGESTDTAILVKPLWTWTIRRVRSRSRSGLPGLPTRPAMCRAKTGPVMF